jgi:hypothetical protein
MLYEAVQDAELEFNDHLRMELGWGDVAKGLNQVLFGYGVFILGVTLGAGLLVIGLFSMLDPGAALHKPAAKPSNASLWMIYLGLGILSVIGLISYGIIVGGQFKCMMGAAERHGARWCMFLTIACLFLGPAFNVAAGISSRQALQDLKKNPAAVKDIQINPLGQWLHLIGFGISMLYPMCFLLFLRATAVCLRVEGQVMLVNAFLVFAGVVVAGTAFMMFQYRPGGLPLPPALALILGGAWVVVCVGYIGLIAITRICIGKVMSTVKSPLAA